MTERKSVEKELRRANKVLQAKIDEHAASDRALRESETRFRMLAENIREVFWMCTPGVNKMIYVSPAYDEIWGQPRSKVMDSPLSWTDNIHPEDRPRVMQQLIEHAHGQYAVEYRIIRPDGTLRWIYDRGFPVHDDQGNLTHMTGIAEDVTSRVAAEKMRRLRDLAAHLQSAREEERKRIAREIHDELGQVLTGLKLEVGWASKHVLAEPPRVHDRLKELLMMIDGAIESVRKITSDLRPDALDSGLVNAIRWQAGEFERRTSIPCSLELPENKETWEGERSTAMFRILQEALTNVARHAGAKSVRVSLREEPEEVVLEVSDDGCGITEGQVTRPSSFGLLGMQERARLAGGTISVTGSAGKGTTLTTRLPRSG